MKQRRMKQPGNGGFTLVEVLIALLVLGVLFVPVSNAFLQSVRINQHLSQQMQDLRDTQTAMEVTLSFLTTQGMAEDTGAEQEKSSLAGSHKPSTATDLSSMASALGALDDLAPDTTLDISPLHLDSPFLVIAATQPGDPGSGRGFTLTTLVLPGEAPWLTPQEHTVVTP